MAHVTTNLVEVDRIPPGVDQMCPNWFCGLGRVASKKSASDVTKARMFEIGYFRQLLAYRKVPTQEVRKGGHKHSEFAGSGRLAAKEIKTYIAPALFAATPPIESLKYLLRRAAQESSMCTMQVDIMKAYFDKEASCDVYVRLPMEDQLDGHEHMCGNLMEAMHGMRDAAQN